MSGATALSSLLLENAFAQADHPRRRAREFLQFVIPSSLSGPGRSSRGRRRNRDPRSNFSDAAGALSLWNLFFPSSERFGPFLFLIAPLPFLPVRPLSFPPCSAVLSLGLGIPPSQGNLVFFFCFFQLVRRVVSPPTLFQRELLRYALALLAPFDSPFLREGPFPFLRYRSGP